MAWAIMISEFLESSTVHGLVHISTANNKALRAIWVTIVIGCFAIAITMITNSYNEWHDSPISTTITTHPIEKIQFPAVTVCPPRGSNTALNQVLTKVKDANFTEKEKQNLLNMSREAFTLGPTKNHAKHLTELLSIDNMQSIINKQASMPTVQKDINMITLKSTEPEGSFSTPGFGSSECSGDFFDGPHTLHYEIEFPKNHQSYIGDGKFVLTVETEGKWSYSWNRTMQFYSQRLNISDAEDFCISQGKHLASLTSKEEVTAVKRLMPYGYGYVWLGGKWNSTNQSWQWIDGRKWDFQEEIKTWSNHEGTQQCLFTSIEKSKLSWGATPCSSTWSFICLDKMSTAKGKRVLSITKNSYLPKSFHVWWKSDPSDRADGCPGIKISWKRENRTVDRREFVSRELSGTVSTPRLGKVLNNRSQNREQEYTVVLNLPDNVTNLLGDSMFVIDINVTLTSLDSGAELWSSYLEWTYKKPTWEDAEVLCMSWWPEGGHLAKIKSPFVWQNAQALFSKHESKSAWLGGFYNTRNGAWMWSDGSKFSFSNWAPGQPSNSTVFGHKKWNVDANIM